MIATIAASAMILIILEGFIYLRSLPIMPDIQKHISLTPRITTLVSEKLRNATGSIASLQNTQWNKPHGTWVEQFSKSSIWLLSGNWSLRTFSTPKDSPMFEAAFSMVMLNGTALHTHTISNFKMIGTPIMDRAKNSTTVQGIATVSINEGALTNVTAGISITIIDRSVIVITLNTAKTDGHFGYTPIFGTLSN